MGLEMAGGLDVVGFKIGELWYGLWWDWNGVRSSFFSSVWGWLKRLGGCWVGL